MSELMSEHKGLVIGLVVLGMLLLGGATAASASGIGADTPPAEKKRGHSVYHGGHFYIFYTGGGFGRGARGVGGRGVRGGGPGMGKPTAAHPPAHPPAAPTGAPTAARRSRWWVCPSSRPWSR